MSNIAIRIEGLSKLYRLGEAEGGYRTLRESLTDTFMAPFRRLHRGPSPKRDAELLWALKDVSFDVKHGEVIGIIGRNGAGKSTLLKILSRITEPTEGHAAIHGRVGSLLEVGTGFHPELTGRENIFLNGAILGMKKAEIIRKFDEIVAFAEVERFIDTAVKHYSSGMYVRLAFAVAAHMEPDILIVDEVLAVGDVEFQKKCLGKMGDVAAQGRTVLFVSHNINAVTMLCNRGIVLQSGSLAYQGDAESATWHYLTQGTGNAGSSPEGRVEISAADSAPVSLRAISVTDDLGRPRNAFGSRDAILIHFEMDIERSSPDLCIGFDLRHATGSVVMRSYQNDGSPEAWPAVNQGSSILTCRIPPGMLNAGTYFLSPRIGYHCKSWVLHVDDVLSFRVILNHSDSPFWATVDEGSRPGTIAPVLQWENLAHVPDHTSAPL